MGEIWRGDSTTKFYSIGAHAASARRKNPQNCKIVIVKLLGNLNIGYALCTAGILPVKSEN